MLKFLKNYFELQDSFYIIPVRLLCHSRVGGNLENSPVILDPRVKPEDDIRRVILDSLATPGSLSIAADGNNN